MKKLIIFNTKSIVILLVCGIIRKCFEIQNIGLGIHILSREVNRCAFVFWQTNYRRISILPLIWRASIGKWSPWPTRSLKYCANLTRATSSTSTLTYVRGMKRVRNGRIRGSMLSMLSRNWTCPIRARPRGFSTLPAKKCRRPPMPMEWALRAATGSPVSKKRNDWYRIFAIRLW